MYFLGYDIGSSSIKCALYNANTNEIIATVQSPESELPILSPVENYAEQDPETWWQHVLLSTQQLFDTHTIDKAKISGIGIAYQMHGLVIIDSNKKIIRPSIIWCDSRAIETGDSIAKTSEEKEFLASYYNMPGNFTFSKLVWVKKNEPENFSRIWKFLLPGDFIALKMTDRPTSTITGLSEGIMWNFEKNEPAFELFDQQDVPRSFIPDIGTSFEPLGKLTESAAKKLGLPSGIPISYRSGDQPNNAFSLNVSRPGILAATGGTSGVIYGVSDQPVIDHRQRTNSFAHVNYTKKTPKIGTLLCINGTGIMYSWIRKNISDSGKSYPQLEKEAAEIKQGSEGLITLPFGNGAERIFQNKTIGGHLIGIDLNRHGKKHIIRSALEGIAFAFVYSIEILQSLGISTETMRVGNDNLFQSKVFSQTIADLAKVNIEMVKATGAVGAAIGAAIGVSYFDTIDDAFDNQNIVFKFQPQDQNPELLKSYNFWKEELKKFL
ncbi:xylulokinase [Membranihabitans maritimus]|uniref:xylulokinase n=1 Tax=Membranihabitans maritimus TaxID=2904244 RepID=UPI001EFF17C4|nr:FGGY family carbohydrate kinase [Membranihabitans maritimus]